MTHPEIGIDVDAHVVLVIDDEKVERIDHDVGPTLGKAHAGPQSHSATDPVMTIEVSAGPSITVASRSSV